MTSPCKNLSQVKKDIKHVINNLQKLKGCEDNKKDIENLMTNTEHLLIRLENSPLERFKYKSKKRQRKKVYKIKRKPNSDDIGKKVKVDVVAVSKIPRMVVSKQLTENNNHNFESIKDCKRFLQTLELLEQLHLARGHNSSETYKFALKLRKLKSIWNSLLQDKLQEQTSIDDKIKQQWNEVMFGPPEKSYFHKKTDLHDFVRKRQIWDSYIDSKFGSSIPIGWIIPKEEDEKWRPYLAPTNI